MRTIALLTLLTLLVPVGVASASAAPQQLLIAVDGHHVRMERTDTYDESQSDAIRRSADKDRDSFVTAAEALEFQQQTSRALATGSDCWQHVRLVSIHGAKPSRLASAEDKIEGLEGDLNEMRNMRWTRIRVLEFPQGDLLYSIRFDASELEQFQSVCPGENKNAFSLSAGFVEDNGSPAPFPSAKVSIPQGLGFVADSLKPTWVVPAGQEILFDSAAIERMSTQALEFRTAEAASPLVFQGTSSEPVAWLPYGIGLVALLALARTPMGTWILFGLFTRLSRHELLENPHRESLHRLVEQEPGASLADLRRATGMPHGTALYHLRILHRHGLLRMRPEGFRTRFFPTGAATDQPYLSPIQQRILATIASMPGASQSQLAASLGMPRKTLAHHLARLQHCGRIAVVAQGRRRMYAPASPVAPVLNA